MKRIILLSILMCAVNTEASPSHWYKDPKWWAGAAVIGAVTALDAHSTCQAFGKGAVEQNWLLRGSTSCGQVSGVATAYAIGEIGLHALAWHCENNAGWHFRGLNQDNSPHASIWKAIAYTAIPAANAAVHIPAAIHNYRLIESQPSIRSGLTPSISGPMQLVVGK